MRRASKQAVSAVPSISGYANTREPKESLLSVLGASGGHCGGRPPFRHDDHTKDLEIIQHKKHKTANPQPNGACGLRPVAGAVIVDF